ncbi:MAG: methyltransferase domain-containing protein [Chloroflexi bacterium]|nr:methyltransferase domain-containing protein [Chloroflexota bacterium]
MILNLSSKWRTLVSGFLPKLDRENGFIDPTMVEVNCIEQALNLPGGSEILDVSCRDGQRTVAFATRGYAMTGVDTAQQHERMSRPTPLREDLNISWHCASSIRETSWPGRFDGAYCFNFNPSRHSSAPGYTEIFNFVARALKPAGKFLLETSQVAEILLPKYERQKALNIEDIPLLFETDYDPTRGEITIKTLCLQHSIVQTQISIHPIYMFRELCGLLEQAGLTIRSSYGSIDLKPFQLGSSRLIILAEKRLLP